MNSEGGTLAEFLIGAGIVGVLMVATGFSYQGWKGGYEIEKATKEIYSDFMHARLRAVQTNVQHVAVLNAYSYLIAEDINENGKYDAGDILLPNFPKPLRYELCDNKAGSVMTFDKRGLISQPRCIWFKETKFDPDHDCIRISMSRLIMGRYQFSTLSGSCITK